MATEVELPQLGESVTEGVITAWLVEVGDEVTVDQPLVEISTDKVDTEIPSPIAGTVTELRAEVDDTIEVGQVIAVIGGDEGDDAGPADAEDSDAEDSDAEDSDAEDSDAEGPDAEDPGEEASAADGPDEPSEGSDTSDQETDGSQQDADETTAGASYGGEPADRPATDPTSGGAGVERGQDGGEVTGEKALASPLVRRLLREAGLTPTQVRGSGTGGRITREDAERAIAAGGEGPSRGDGAATDGGAGKAAPVTPPPAPSPAGERSRPEASPTQIDFGGERQVTQELSRVRKAIARSMLHSLQTTAQLTAAVEVDVTNIMHVRAARKDAFKATHGASLSPLPMIARAALLTLPRHPTVNSSIDTEEGTATFRSYVNLGMAIDTERGLMVPNIKDAQDLNVAGLARQITDLAARTRNKKLQPDEISGGTFTITNTGSRGTLFDTPILNPPEVAIVATCAIEKRPVVISDAYGDSIAIRWMTYLCMSYDHRMLDGADAARFLQDLKFVIETHDWASEIGV